MYSKTKTFIQVWNYLRVSKWWQNFHFWVNYPFKPLLKKSNLDSTILSNYRPISNLPFIGKIIEKVVFKSAEQLLKLKWIPGQFSIWFLTASQHDVTCGQIWLPILGICALHLTHTPWTHPRSKGQPFMLRGAVGGSVPCSRAPQSWYWRWKRALYIHSPHRQFLPELRLELATFGLRVRLSNH